MAALIAAGIFALAVGKGSTVAGGADSSGYISESAVIAAGRLTQDRPLARHVPWPVPEWTMAPLGWRPGVEPAVIAPVYAAGYPLVMAAARLVGGERAIYWVVPALAALAVWLTFVLGRRLESPLTGVLAAALLATSPPFVFQALQPMSDVPTTAWWAAALVLAMRATPLSLVGSGIAAALAVLTRPNLAPIGAAIAVYLLWRLLSDRASLPWHRPVSPKRSKGGALALFSAFAVPFAASGAVVAWLHQHLYGSAFLSGYGAAETLYALENYTPNLHRYTRWLFQTETRLVLAGLIAPIVLVRRRRSTPIARGQMSAAILGVAIALIVFASYLFYAPFDDWKYLRFLIPAYPALFVLVVTSFRRAGESLGARGAVVFTAVACTTIAYTHVRTIRAEDLLLVGAAEQRYRRVTDFVATRIAGRPAIVGLQHTGSTAYYTNRLTLRWDWLDGEWLDEAIADLQARGYRPLILLDEWEESEFRGRYAEETFGKLDWPPLAQTDPPMTRLYDPADRARFLAGETRPVETIK